MEYILLVLALVIIGYVIKFTWQDDKHHRWFSNLKPGDHVLVRIFSINCDCSAKATITSLPNGKSITAKLDNKDYDKCKTCAEINGTDDKNNETCWYHITTFNRKNVAKLEE